MATTPCHRSAAVVCSASPRCATTRHVVLDKNKQRRGSSWRFGEQGHPENIAPAIQSKLVPMMIANYAVWPVAHLINFKFVPPQQRILYINCCQARLRPAPLDSPCTHLQCRAGLDKAQVVKRTCAHVNMEGSSCTCCCKWWDGM